MIHVYFCTSQCKFLLAYFIQNSSRLSTRNLQDALHFCLPDESNICSSEVVDAGGRDEGNRENVAGAFHDSYVVQ